MIDDRQGQALALLTNGTEPDNTQFIIVIER